MPARRILPAEGNRLLERAVFSGRDWLRRLCSLADAGRLRAKRKAMSRWLRRRLVECHIPQCRRFHLSHAWLRRAPGIRMVDAWYCGAACLRDGVEREAGAQQAAAAAVTRRPPRMPYRLILLARGIVNEAQLREARATLSGPGRKDELGEALVHLGYATEDQVASARAAQEGCACYSARPEPVPTDLCPPVALMRRYQAVPVHHLAANRRLLLGFVHRVEPRLLEAVAQITGCRVEACVVTRAIYREQMSRRSAEISGAERRGLSGVTGEAVVEDRPAAIAALVLTEALRRGADEVRMARLGETLWLRLAGEKQTFDLLAELVPEASEHEAMGGANSPPVGQRGGTLAAPKRKRRPY